MITTVSDTERLSYLESAMTNVCATMAAVKLSSGPEGGGRGWKRFGGGASFEG